MTAAFICNEGNGACGDGELALGEFDESLPAAQFLLERGPVEAKVGTDAGIGGDAEIIFEEKIVDAVHGNKCTKHVLGVQPQKIAMGGPFSEGVDIILVK